MPTFFGGYLREELDEARRVTLATWPSHLMSAFKRIDNDETFINFLDKQKANETLRELLEDYDAGYYDGYEDALLSRTQESMSTIRTIRRKLDNARRVRDEYALCIRRAGEMGWDGAVAESSHRSAGLVAKNRELEMMVDVLRQEIVRLQGENREQARKAQQLRGAALMDSFNPPEQG
jgi:hypothetical protein